MTPTASLSHEMMTDTRAASIWSWLAIGMGHQTYPYKQETTKQTGVTVTQGAEEVCFSETLNGYFAARGPEIRAKREALLRRMKQPPYLPSRARAVLDFVRQSPSEEVLEAAIDLLSGAGVRVVRMAEKMAFEETINEGEDAAFALATAAGRIDEEVMTRILLVSRHEVIREAAIELLADLPPARAKPALERRMREDPSECIKKRASQLLAEF